MLKTLQPRLQQYMNWELSDVTAGLEKAEEPEIKFPASLFNSNIKLPTKAREFQKNIYVFFIKYIKVFDYVDHNKLENSSRDGNTRPLTYHLRNLYAGQEATVQTGHGTTDWFQIGKGVCQGCILSPSSFNLYAEYIMGNAGLDEAQAGIKIVGRNINNLR